MLRASSLLGRASIPALVLVFASLLTPIVQRPASAGVTAEEVERAIRNGVHFLKQQQRGDGSWPDVEGDAQTGTTSLVTLALLTAGEKSDSPTIRKALELLRSRRPEDLRSTYAIGLQTMVYAATSPEQDRLRIAANVDWLERAQIKPSDPADWSGSWTYNDFKRAKQGDNSNSQYALLGLHAASEVGVRVKPEVWTLARDYWVRYQKQDGSWAYKPDSPNASASMTCTGISSLIISGLRRYQGQETLQGETIHNCGKGGHNRNLQKGIDWLARNFQVGENFPSGQVWKYYYLYGLERAGRLTGIRYFGSHDWYRLGAEELVQQQDKLGGYWRGTLLEQDPIISTAFALLFLAKGRAPVLINKLYHQPLNDWNNDPDDIRNLVEKVSADWKSLLTWQIVNPDGATVPDLLQAPILFFNGHRAPGFTQAARDHIRQYVEQGGFLFVDACCGSEEFDRGFREMIKAVFPPGDGFHLKPLPPEHPVWRAHWELSPDRHPLWGIEHGCRTVAIYSPGDLSCYWNQVEHYPTNTAVDNAIKIGQNVVDYATGREMPDDKLVIREVHNFKEDTPKPGALRVAKLRHAGDWNIAPQAIPNLMDALRHDPFRFDVVLTQKDLFPNDPSLIYYPLLYIHGRGTLSFTKEHLEALRKHLDPGGGTLFADAACGSSAFDAAFRRFAAELLPDHKLEPIPREDELYTDKIGFNLDHSQYTKAAGGGQDFPQLEGIKIGGHWAVIYSKLDLGCALKRHSGIDCKGYDYKSAVKIAGNIVIYSTLP